jgi:hypothetical protein
MEKFTIHLKTMLLEKLYVLLLMITVICANAVLIVTVGAIQEAFPLERALIGLAISLAAFGGSLYLTIKARRIWKRRELSDEAKEQPKNG